MYKRFVKRILDLIVSFAAILLLSPFFVLISLLLLWLNRGKVFFVQERPGKDGRLFKLLKFRTMRESFDRSGKLRSDRERLTRAGKVIRAVSLDEIPQFINVLKGDMSLIGPRPLLTDYLDLYSSYHARRHEVLPGITGWAQVNGRNAISWDKRLDLDVWYVDNTSLKLDIQIFFRTIKKVIAREGINSAKSSTMERFTGSTRP